MGKLGNIFGVLALLLAGAAAFFSFTISERRAEFRLRADKMAATVAEIVQAIDDESGTSVASEVSFTAGNVDEGTKGEGSLSAIKFHEAKDEGGEFADFQGVLEKAVDHVNSLATRRTQLAETIYVAAQTLEFPEDQFPEETVIEDTDEEEEEGDVEDDATEDEEEGDLEGALEGEEEGEEEEEEVEVQGVMARLAYLRDPDVFADAAERIQAHVAAVKDRDDAMLKTLTAAARVIDEPINEQALTARKESQDDEGNTELGAYPCEATLGDFEKNVVALDKRSTAYSQTLVAAMDKVKAHEDIFEWKADRTRIKSKRESDYGPAHSDYINDLMKLNEQLDNLVAARADLVAKKQRIGELETDLDVANKKVNEGTKTMEEQVATIRKLRRDLAVALGEDIPTTTDGGTTEIVGAVKRVDTEFNYVILNIGRGDKVTQGSEWLVARGDEYIARVKVAEVHQDNCVADILPLAMNGTVKPDDMVIRVDPPKQRQQ